MNVTFSWNEWYFILTSLIVFLLFWPVRNYFPLPILVIVWIYNMTLVATIDYFLIATPYTVYYFGDNVTYELSGALYHFFMYPCTATIFLFVYDKWELYGKKTIWYIGIWSVIALWFEWLTVLNGALTYTGWKLLYSVPTYPIASVMLIVLYRFSKRKLQELSFHKFMKTKI